MKIITFEKAPKKFLETFRDLPICKGVTPNGVTLVPKKTDGFQKLEIYIQEKMGQYTTRVAIAHELYHCLQYLCECEVTEGTPDEIDVVMVKSLKEKRKKKAGQYVPCRKH